MSQLIFMANLQAKLSLLSIQIRKLMVSDIELFLGNTSEQLVFGFGVSDSHLALSTVSPRLRCLDYISINQCHSMPSAILMKFCRS